VLGNTPAVCRRSYIHPHVFVCYEDDIVVHAVRVAGLRAIECTTLALLQRKLREVSRRAESSAPTRRSIHAGNVNAGAPGG
jgi:DNA topoisomerase IB